MNLNVINHVFAGTFPYFHTIPILRKGFQNRLILGSNEAGQSKSLMETPNRRGIALMADGRIRFLKNTYGRFRLHTKTDGKIRILKMEDEGTRPLKKNDGKIHKLKNKDGGIRLDEKNNGKICILDGRIRLLKRTDDKSPPLKMANVIYDPHIQEDGKNAYTQVRQED